ncbi:hypothetical protein PM082_014512 [Marasmius tenuissimus]|nr:hypothetical protein PM082_014512 [Marasmius tenuissimus]
MTTNQSDKTKTRSKKWLTHYNGRTCLAHPVVLYPFTNQNSKTKQPLPSWPLLAHTLIQNPNPITAYDHQTLFLRDLELAFGNHAQRSIQLQLDNYLERKLSSYHRKLGTRLGQRVSGMMGGCTKTSLRM